MRAAVFHGNPFILFALPNHEILSQELDSVRAIRFQVLDDLNGPPLFEPVE